MCPRKSRASNGPVTAKVRIQLARNEKGRVRIFHVDTYLDPHFAAEDSEKAAHCGTLFETY